LRGNPCLRRNRRRWTTLCGTTWHIWSTTWGRRFARRLNSVRGRPPRAGPARCRLKDRASGLQASRQSIAKTCRPLCCGLVRLDPFSSLNQRTCRESGTRKRKDARIQPPTGNIVHSSFRIAGRVGWTRAGLDRRAGLEWRAFLPLLPGSGARTSQRDRLLDMRCVMPAVPGVHRDRFVDGHASPLLVHEDPREAIV